MNKPVITLSQKIDIVKYALSKGIRPIKKKYFLFVLPNGETERLSLNRWLLKQVRVSKKQVRKQEVFIDD